MIIRKLFKFENAHVVRNCSSNRCKYSIHGHSYRVEVLLKSRKLDNGQMVYDFGLMKGPIKEIIDSFDHATVFWNKDDPEYIEAIKKFSSRWISLPVSPSAEQLARVIWAIVNRVIRITEMNNGEGIGLRLDSVIVHETDTGYAQAFRDDINCDFINEIMAETEFSNGVWAEWSDPELWEKIQAPIRDEEKVFVNPTPVIQVSL